MLKREALHWMLKIIGEKSHGLFVYEFTLVLCPNDYCLEGCTDRVAMGSFHYS